MDGSVPFGPTEKSRVTAGDILKLLPTQLALHTSITPSLSYLHTNKQTHIYTHTRDVFTYPNIQLCQTNGRLMPSGSAVKKGKRRMMIRVSGGIANQGSHFLM